MTRPYSIAFKQKMINRLTGRDAVSANQLAKDTGIRQQILSRWLREARNLPLMESNNQAIFTWTVEQKARLLADASNPPLPKAETLLLAYHPVPDIA